MRWRRGKQEITQRGAAPDLVTYMGAAGVAPDSGGAAGGCLCGATRLSVWSRAIRRVGGRAVVLGQLTPRGVAAL